MGACEEDASALVRVAAPSTDAVVGALLLSESRALLGAATSLDDMVAVAVQTR